MRKSELFVLANVLVVVSACCAEKVKRTTYETLQNIEEGRCEKDLSADCTGRESYETYKRRVGNNEARDY
jgi:hypothetical protein